MIKTNISDPEDEKKVRVQIMRELKILRVCRSPTVVSFYGAFLNEQDIYIMMEYMNFGSLEHISKKGPIPEPVVATIGSSIIQGLTYLYQNHKIVHRGIYF